ncbi:translation initiation factor IF-2-like [Prionailurus viverrinus]|uniref:translation initiation factor IF-2-like n=1 Tax=Prionailurus viverrinus TaxID=61388 RepID=UPI001FF2F6EB|nr:translation initiation factor IF-2-like [Prionailurus viverrinus]
MPPPIPEAPGLRLSVIHRYELLGCQLGTSGAVTSVLRHGFGREPAKLASSPEKGAQGPRAEKKPRPASVRPVGPEEELTLKVASQPKGPQASLRPGHPAPQPPRRRRAPPTRPAPVPPPSRRPRPPAGAAATGARGGRRRALGKGRGALRAALRSRARGARSPGSPRPPCCPRLAGAGAAREAAAGTTRRERRGAERSPSPFPPAAPAPRVSPGPAER